MLGPKNSKPGDLPTTITKSVFESHRLTLDELRIGSTYNYLQRQVIQNLLCDLAVEKVNLVAVPNDPASVHYEAELLGKIHILQDLLELDSIVPENP